MWYQRASFILLAAACLIVSACSDNAVDSEGTGYVVDTLFVTADALVSSAVPSGAHGESAELIVGSITYSEGYRFDVRTLIGLPDIADSVDRSKIFFAELILSSSSGDSLRNDTVFAYRVQADWREDSVTWLNQPAFDSLPFASNHIDSGKLAISVYPLYLDSVGGKSLILTSTGSEQYFYSRETLGLNVSPIIVLKRRN